MIPYAVPQGKVPNIDGYTAKEIAGLLESRNQNRIFQSDKYDNSPDVKPNEFKGDRFTLETILEDGKLVTFIGVWKDTTGKRNYELIDALQFEFKAEKRQPTKPTNDISRLEVTLKRHKTYPELYGVCQIVRQGARNPTKLVFNRYIGVAW